MSNLIGQSIGRYHILEQLGEGGMATVYKAFDTRLERDVAVKVIRVDQFAPAVLERILKRFEREAKVLARLTHPNIVHINDFGEHDGIPYLVMDYLPGGTLKQRLGKPMPWQDAVRLLLPIARALQFAHGQAIIHRDVKPSNILVTLSGEPMLSDFGIAKILEGDETTTLTGFGIGVGTPEYMAPEQWIGQTTPQSDIYSLGVVFYEMITGYKPYVADTPAAILLKQANEPLPRPRQFVPSLPGEVEKILFKALAHKPEDRYQNMSELACALEELNRVVGKVEQQAAIWRAKSDMEDAKTMMRPGETTDELRTVEQAELPQQQSPPQSPRKRMSMWIPIALAAFFAFAALVLALIGGASWLFTRGPLAAVHPTSTLPSVKQGQIYIMHISGTTLNTAGSGGTPVSLSSGESLDFVSGRRINVADSASGYVQLIFPGQAEVFFSPGTEITLISSNSSGVVLQLDKGRILIRLPDDFPIGRKFVFRNAFGASAWVSGSLMGVKEETTQNWLYVDCFEHECWVSNGTSEQHLPAGYHATLNGSSMNPQLGTDTTLWEFAPDMVASPTATLAFVLPSPSKFILTPAHTATSTKWHTPIPLSPTQCQSLDPPNLLSPPNGTTFSTTDIITFEWSDSYGATEYRIAYSDSKYYFSQSSWSSSTSYTLSGLLPETYSWGVQAQSPCNLSGYSSLWSFTVNP
jgi:serine/threonine protein kinase